MYQPLPTAFQTELDRFFRALTGKNRSPKTILAYSTDLGQFLAWVADNDITGASEADINRTHVIDFMVSLSERKLTGVSRARKLAAMREFFKHLVAAEVIAKSPTTGIDTPKIEHIGRCHCAPVVLETTLMEITPVHMEWSPIGVGVAGARRRTARQLPRVLQYSMTKSGAAFARYSTIPLRSRETLSIFSSNVWWTTA